MDYLELLSAVPDIGDKQAREITIARMAYEAGKANSASAEEIKQLRKIATLAVRVADSAWQEKAGECVFPQSVMLELDAAIRERIKYGETLKADA